jgi:hypothetical protein
LRPVLSAFGGTAKHDEVEDSLRHQMNKHVVSCAAPCPPPSGQSGASCELRCLPQVVSAISSVYPPPRLVFPHNNAWPSSLSIQPLSVLPAPIPLTKVKEVQHLFGSEDGAALLFLMRPANHRPCRPGRIQPQPDRPIGCLAEISTRCYLCNQMIRTASYPALGQGSTYSNTRPVR